MSSPSSASHAPEKNGSSPGSTGGWQASALTILDPKATQLTAFPVLRVEHDLLRASRADIPLDAFLGMNTDDNSQILIDTGAGESMMGDHWLERHKMVVQRNPHQFPAPKYSMSAVEGPRSVSGVGTGSTELTHVEEIPIGVPGRIGVHHFKGFVMKNSECPALRGAKSLS